MNGKSIATKKIKVGTINLSAIQIRNWKTNQARIRHKGHGKQKVSAMGGGNELKQVASKTYDNHRRSNMGELENSKQQHKATR
jgi:hypothetical protein